MKKTTVLGMTISDKGLLLLTACSSTPDKPDYRAEQQRQGAAKAQQELSRKIKKN